MPNALGYGTTQQTHTQTQTHTHKTANIIPVMDGSAKQGSLTGVGGLGGLGIDKCLSKYK